MTKTDDLKKSLARNINPNLNRISNHHRPRSNIESKIQVWFENFQPGKVVHEELPEPYNSTIVLAVPREDPDIKKDESVETNGKFYIYKI